MIESSKSQEKQRVIASTEKEVDKWKISNI